jgi:hypothetical protein
MLEDVYSKLRKFFEIMGQKYQAMGQLEKSDDFFYLTLEEVLAFEEGRASTIAWKNLVAIRKEEYRRYASDVKVPETWFTTGLVGLAAQYPSIIAIRDRKSAVRTPSIETLESESRLNVLDANKITNKSSGLEFKLTSETLKKDSSFILSGSSTDPVINKLDFIEDNKSKKTDSSVQSNDPHHDVAG